MNYDYSATYDYSTALPTTDMSGMAEVLGGTALLFSGVMLVISIIIGLAVYIYTAIAFMKIAERTKTPNGWFAWIPILNIVLMLQIAKMHWAYIFLFLIPFVNIVMIFVVLWKVLEARKRPGWWSLLMLVPFLGQIWYLIFVGILAWSKE